MKHIDWQYLIDKQQPMTAEQIAWACESAADVLEGNWTQGDWERYEFDEADDYTPFADQQPVGITRCIEGGLAAAMGLNTDQLRDQDSLYRVVFEACPVYQAVQTTIVLREGNGDYRVGLIEWNDDDGRKEQEVLDLLRATAKRVLTEAQEVNE